MYARATHQCLIVLVEDWTRALRSRRSALRSVYRTSLTCVISIASRRLAAYVTELLPYTSLASPALLCERRPPHARSLGWPGSAVRPQLEQRRTRTVRPSARAAHDACDWVIFPSPLACARLAPRASSGEREPQRPSARQGSPRHLSPFARPSGSEKMPRGEGWSSGA